MGDIDCAFDGHLYRADICQGKAESFFRTARGTVWPLCPACSAQHKKTMVTLVEHHAIDTNMACGATFDIPLDDRETLASFQRQDPRIIEAVIEQADTQLLTSFRKEAV